MTRLKYNEEEKRAQRYKRLFESLQREHQLKQTQCKREQPKQREITYEWLIRNTVLIKTCENCGKQFYTQDDKVKYCDKTCRKRQNNKLIRAQRQHQKNNNQHDSDITLTALYQRDNGKCYLCGGQCDLEDYKIINGARIGKAIYPSIDHIKPLAKGGTHTWDNVKLAHTYCNQKKASREYPTTPPPKQP